MSNGSAFGITAPPPTPAPAPTLAPQPIPPTRPSHVPNARRHLTEDLATTERALRPQVQIVAERLGEKEAERLTWFLDNVDVTIAGLRAATLFHVSEPMTRVAVDAARDIPLDTTLNNRAPARRGLVLFAGGLPEFYGLSGDEEALRPELIFWEVGGEGMHFGAFARASSHPHAGSGGMNEALGGVRWLPAASFDTPFDKPISELDAADPTVLIAERNILSVLLATWTLMGTPTVADTTERVIPGPRPAGSRKRSAPSPVNVVTLRPMRRTDNETGQDDDGQDDTDRTKRAYTHQWVVRGHWRNQPYGKDRASRRLTWVPSHLKGPEGAPLITTETVFAWRN